MTMADSNKLLPILLPTRPSCDECMAWSSDHLAIAGGEFVHILTPKTSLPRHEIAGHPDWHILSLRVNVFRQAEWPDQELANINDLSLGEEQTNSHVVALEWSDAGLGMHRRSVLAVLTSNLVLSIWETDGTPACYERACVINNCAAFTSSKTDRRALRIRAFTWLPSLVTGSTSKWGFHYLVVVNDHEEIIILRVSKHENLISEGWKVTSLLTFSLKDLKTVMNEAEFMSPLQKRLYKETPINRIKASSWYTLDAVPNAQSAKDENTYWSELVITKGNSLQRCFLSARVSESGQDVLSLEHEQEDEPLDMAVEGSSGPWTAKKAKRRINMEETYFKEAVQPLQDDFDTTFQLFGHFRTRYWGSAVSPDNTKAAACITLHPSDMIEYTIPSAEKCTVVFTNIKESIVDRTVEPKSLVSVHESILSRAKMLLDERYANMSSFDEKLLRTYQALAGASQNLSPQLKAAWKALDESTLRSGIASPSQEKPGDKESGQEEHGARLGFEECEICSASIAFTSDVSVAICTTGHQFSRCQLTFLAVQEPGISKYCSQCGKQFLDLSKLGAFEGPSLIQAMFDEFDTCPYCYGKFRG